MFHSRWRIKCRPYCYNSRVPGKSAATASLVLGIIAAVLWFFGMTSILSVILGIIGLILAGNAKKLGLSEEYRLQDLSITAALLDFSWLLFCMQGVIKFHIPI